MSLVPDAPGPTPHHWCTWQRQGAEAALRAGDPAALLDHAGAQRSRDALAAGTLDAWLRELHPRCRGDLLAVLDDGWDLPAADAAAQRPWFGELAPHPDRFPGPADPALRLAALVDQARAHGWRGLGAWVCVQEAPRACSGWGPMPAEREAYWAERARRFRDAGATYWKCDWGAASRDEEFRRMLSRVAREHHRALWVEHTVCRWPLNDWQRDGRLHDDLLRAGASTLAYSDVFRLYDVLAPLSLPTTLERLARHLAEPEPRPRARRLLHAEDEVYLGAVLGCVLGVMRYPSPAALADRPNPVFPPRFEAMRAILGAQDEVARAVRWSRIAPAWSAGADVATLDRTTHEDSWAFAPGETTFSPVIGRVVRQCAPARVARGLPLPTVRAAGDAPYVVAARHPDGPCALGAFGRVDAVRGWRVPWAEVGIDIGDAAGPLGVFGHFGSLEVRAVGLRPGLRILAQDLLADTPEDITAAVHLEPGRMLLPGTLLDRIGVAAATPGDRSEPGLVLAWRTRG